MYVCTSICMGQVLEIVGESGSKSKTGGSICIRWKIRKKLGEFRASQRDGLKFRNWKLETLHRRPMACVCRSVKGTAFHSSLPIVLPRDTITVALKFTRETLSIPSFSDSIVRIWVEESRYVSNSLPRSSNHRILFQKRKGNRFDRGK